MARTSEAEAGDDAPGEDRPPERMLLIPRPLHGLLDYFVGLLLAASPWLFGFAGEGVAMQLPVVLGIGAVLYSLVTKYEFGVIKILTFRDHLVADVLSGALLAASPWLFGFADRLTMPHVGFGVFAVLVALFTCPDMTPTKHRRVHRPAHGTPLSKLP